MYGTTIGGEAFIGWPVADMMGTTVAGVVSCCKKLFAAAITGPPLVAAGIGDCGCCWGEGVGTPLRMACIDAELGYLLPISDRLDLRDWFRPFRSLFSAVSVMTVRWSSSIMDFFRFLDSRALMRFCSRRSLRLLFSRLL